MALKEPDFTIGIEEEYLLVDRDSLALSPAPEGLMEACQAELQDQISPEYLTCQIEIGSKVCGSIGEAREDLKHLRRTVADVAAQYNLLPIAASCHPFGDWREQRHTRKDRYDDLRRDLGWVVRRMLICGMHVHVGIDSPDMRIDLMNQLGYFLPHLLALSCSSPFWQGEDTGLASHRLSVFDNLPRTGLPPQLDSWAQFDRSVDALTTIGVIEDGSKIWWDLRPSSRFPTLESRICDVSPRLEHALTLAALTQALTRMLWRLATRNQRWRLYDRFLIEENRWRAQRYGTSEGMIDFGQRAVLPFGQLAEELIGLLQDDGAALQSMAEIEGIRDILKGGTSAERQRKVFTGVMEAGGDKDAALRSVVEHLAEEFHADL